MSQAPHTISLDHPKRGALTPALVEHLEGELDRAAGRPLLLTGTDKAFSAGLDLAHVAELDGAAMLAYLERVDRLAQRLFEHPAPTVARVEGHAIAGGCVLVQCCDWRVACAVEKVRIGVSELALGAPFPPRILRLLENRLPAHTRRRVMLGGELFAPNEALALGLVDEVVEDATTRADAALERLASHPADAYACTKRGLNRGVMDPTPADEARYRDEEIPLWIGPAMRERIQAFLGR